MPTQSVTDKAGVRDFPIVRVTGIFTWRLVADGITFPLYEPSEFNDDDVKQGSYHLMLSGKMRRDVLGTRQHFFMKWRKLTIAEATYLRQIITTCSVANEVFFVCHLGVFRVVIANIEPHIYDMVGYVDTGLTLEETQ